MLGDKHNFGQIVSLSLDGKWVEKPRFIGWEWLLLGAESPLRRLIDRTAVEHGMVSPFRSIPSLAFRSNSMFRSGMVERVIDLDSSEAMATHVSDHFLQDVGSFIAFALCLGISDLHSENMMLGTDRNGQSFLVPVDVECVLGDLSMPSQTNLIASRLRGHNTSGFNNLASCSQLSRQALNVAAICEGYLQGLSLLRMIDAEIAALLFNWAQQVRAPIRILLRDTMSYFAGGQYADTWLQSEIEQLDRGDVPGLIQRRLS